MKRNSGIDYKEYSLNQYKKTYASTIDFVNFISKYINLKNKSLIDLACGGGANTIYLSKKFENSNFLGVDVSSELINIGKKKLSKLPSVNNCRFVKANWLNLHKSNVINNYDGIISFQSLSYTTYPYEKYLVNLKKKKFDFLAFSSLFYDGDCEYKIYINDFSSMKKKGANLYNIISTKKIKKILSKNGYKKFKYSRFNINIDLKKPKHSGMQSYTVNLKNKRKYIFSGSLYIPYGFFLAY